MTPLPVPSLPDRLRAHAHLHPESAELLREAADVIDLCENAPGLRLHDFRGPVWCRVCGGHRSFHTEPIR